MEEALRRRLILLAFVPLVIVVAALVAALAAAVFWGGTGSWSLLGGGAMEFTVGAIVLGAALVAVELVVLIHVTKIVGRGTRVLTKAIETGRIPHAELPKALKGDVEFTILMRRIEQVMRGGKEDGSVSKRLSQTEEEIGRIANAIEEVSVGSPYIPLPEREGMTQRLTSLLNGLLPEFCQLRKSSVKEIQSMEEELRRTQEATQEVAVQAERSFLESTEALVVAREAGKLAAEAREKLFLVAGEPAKTRSGKDPQKEVRDAITGVIETAARGIEELTQGLIKAGALSRSSERIANRASVLALNVAVEAARASLPGMNILAEEIRKLAEFARGCSDESASLVKEIEAKVDSVIRTIHFSQEKARLRTRALGDWEHAREGEDAREELDRIMTRLGDAVVRLLTRVQELSRLTERTSREAERVSRKAASAHDQSRVLFEGESWKSPTKPSIPGEIESLSDEDLLVEDSSEKHGGE
ncbi:MAG: methyl-accepting chemotaxis protein [Candidatus Eisenbacteria bacterium]